MNNCGRIDAHQWLFNQTVVQHEDAAEQWFQSWHLSEAAQELAFRRMVTFGKEALAVQSQIGALIREVSAAEQ